MRKIISTGWMSPASTAATMFADLLRRRLAHQQRQPTGGIRPAAIAACIRAKKSPRDLAAVAPGDELEAAASAAAR